MKSNRKSLAKIMAIGFGILVPLGAVTADPSGGLSSQTAAWWQWALSIPVSVNPITDTTGANCMVGQRGDTWYLAGIFAGTSATRTCSIPKGKKLFFPIYNSVNINAPNICGQAGSLSTQELRALSKSSIDAVTRVAVELDGKALAGAKRVQSIVFSAALPTGTIFDALCGENIPAGIYSPAVDDGYYIQLDRLALGSHKLHFSAKSNSDILQDVTYDLQVTAVER